MILQMPPSMLKLKHNQGALATALETMTDKVSALSSRLPFLEKELRGSNEKISNQGMYERELQSKLKVLYKNLIEIKKSVHNLLDPRVSIYNIDNGQVDCRLLCSKRQRNVILCIMYLIFAK